MTTRFVCGVIAHPGGDLGATVTDAAGSRLHWLLPIRLVEMLDGTNVEGHGEYCVFQAKG